MSAIALEYQKGWGGNPSVPGLESVNMKRLAGEDHEECGSSSFYPLSPVHMSLFYSLVPELSID